MAAAGPATIPHRRIAASMVKWTPAWPLLRVGLFCGAGVLALHICLMYEVAGHCPKPPRQLPPSGGISAPTPVFRPRRYGFRSAENARIWVNLRQFTKYEFRNRC